jgi:hypothetical protein
MPSPKIKFTSGSFLNCDSGVIAKATKKRPLTLQKRNGKKGRKGGWMYIETEIFYSMVRRRLTDAEIPT